MNNFFDIKISYIFLFILIIYSQNQYAEKLKFMQYNILASKYGINYEHFFIYSDNLDDELKFKNRAEICSKVRTYSSERGEGNNLLHINLKKWIYRCVKYNQNRYEIDEIRKDGECNVIYDELLSKKELQKIIEYNHNYFIWEKRYKRILEKISEIEPDIFSLVELDHYSDFKSYFNKQGYESIFSPRSLNRVDSDGSAIFYKKDLMNLIKRETLYYYKDENYKELDGKIALIGHFRTKKENIPFTFVSTHLFRLAFLDSYNKKRLFELKQLLSNLEIYKKRNAVIIAGDFNTLPNSSPYEFLNKSGYIPSIYKETDFFNSCTSNTILRKEWIDYIFVSENNKAKVVDKMDVPICKKNDMWPDEEVPSDHIPIYVVIDILN